MEDLLVAVRRYVQRYALFAPGAAVVVGVSGGPDSLCLLHLLCRLQPELDLRLHVAHLNHGLRGAESDADAAFVVELAAAWAAPCTVGQVDVRALAAAPGISLEEAARLARYRFLAGVALAVGAPLIAVGHNADDQAETVLMHFLRGSGAAGLRGMLPRAPLGEYRLGGQRIETDKQMMPGEQREGGARAQGSNGAQEGHLVTSPARCWRGRTPCHLVTLPGLWLVRPLLATPRAEIEAYCVEHDLRPRFDRSNEDTTFFRNRLRHELLPILADYNPAIRDVLVRTAEVMAGDHQVLRSALASAWVEVTVPAGPGEVQFDLTGWRALPPGLQRAMVREAIHRLRHTLRNINWAHVERGVWLGRTGDAGQSATLAAGLALQIGYDRLRVADEGRPWATNAPQISAAMSLAAPGITPVGDGWQVQVRLLSRAALPADYDAGADPWGAWLDAEVVGPALALRPRQPGDRFQPHGLDGHSVRLNEFMINARAPRDARAGWPLLVGATGLAWVCGLRVDQRAAVRP
ncbi:MAG: tRNA lysidine(34) synthetase TilS, partial [Chloroflexi bacterium HGW-Chloroflexi-1]